MSKYILDNLFGSRIRIKMLKFLFRNYPKEFTVRELVKRIQEPREVIKQEIATLKAIGLIKRKR